jgi:choline monooxygenase
MISMPEFKEVKNFPTAADDLHGLPLFQWEQLYFTALSAAHPAEYFFDDMIRRLSWLPLREFVFRPERSKDYFVDAHWALYCENYLEGFHIPFVHSGLNAVIDYGAYTTELFRYSNLQLGIAKDGEDCFELPPSSPDYGKKIAAYYFWVFPNMMFNFYPWGLSINIVQPLSPGQTKVSFLVYSWREEKYNLGAGSDLDKVEQEDEEVVQQVQKGIRSRFYDHGRYSVTREQGTHHFHRLIAEFMN